MQEQHLYEVDLEKAKKYLLALGVKRAHAVGVVGSHIEECANDFVVHMYVAEHWSAWKDTGFSTAYATKCAVNLALDFLEEIQTIATNEVSSEICKAEYESRSAGQPGPEADACVAESQRELRAAIAALPARQAEIVRLRFYGELSYVQIGEVMGITADAVRMALKRDLPRLRKRLEACEFDPDEALRGYHPPPPQ